MPPWEGQAEESAELPLKRSTHDFAGALISPHQDTPDDLEGACSGVVECSVTAMSAAERAVKRGLLTDYEL